MGRRGIILLDFPPGTGDIALDVHQMIPQSKEISVTTPHATAAFVAARCRGNGIADQPRDLGRSGEYGLLYMQLAGRRNISSAAEAAQIGGELHTELMAQIPLGAPDNHPSEPDYSPSVYKADSETGKLFTSWRSGSSKTINNKGRRQTCLAGPSSAPCKAFLYCGASLAAAPPPLLPPLPPPASFCSSFGLLSSSMTFFISSISSIRNKWVFDCFLHDRHRLLPIFFAFHHFHDDFLKVVFFMTSINKVWYSGSVINFLWICSFSFCTALAKSPANFGSVMSFFNCSSYCRVGKYLFDGHLDLLTFWRT